MVAKAKGNRGLIAVSVIVYLVSVIALTPVNVLYKMFAPESLPVEVVAVSGTLWTGQAVIKHPMVGQVTGDWSLSAGDLLTGRVKADIELNSNLAQLSGQVTANPLTLDVWLEDTTGYVSASLINQALVKSKTQINGDFELNKSNIHYNLKSGESESASGQLVWLGGQVVYPKGRKHASAQLPMLVAKLSSQNKELQADVSTVEGLSLASASMKKDGWANLAVRKAMIDLVGEKWPNKVSQDAIVVELSERVFTR